MGNNIIKSPCTLSKDKIEEFVELSKSVFDASEIRAIWCHFMTISEAQELISQSQFQGAMLFRDSALLDRIFRAFDTNDDGFISFSEYVACLSIISNKATQEDKLKLSFRMYDVDTDDKIGVSDLTSLVAATLREHDVIITRQDIDLVVAKTMEEAKPAEPGFINYNEYLALVSGHPQMLAPLTLNITGIISKYSAAGNVSFATPRGGSRQGVRP